MLAISTKLTLLVLLLPISILAVLDATVFYFYGTLVIEFSNLLSSILVSLLVWERLRDSLSKKLEYLNDDIFLHLLVRLQQYDLLLFPQVEIRKARDDLKRHARFMTIALFPRKLLKKLDDFLLLHEDFLYKFNKILEIVEKKVGKPNKWIIGHYLDSEHFPDSSTTPEQEKTYLEVMESLGEKLDEAKTSFQKTISKRNEIPEELEEFLKCNNLKIRIDAPIRGF